MSIKYFSILSFLCSFFILGCSSSSPDTQAYSCTLPCLQGAPALSVASVSGATGGAIDVTLNFSGDITNINRVDISLRNVNSGNSAGSSSIFSPATQVLTETITVDSGTALSSYYPFVIIYTNASNTSSRYYRETGISTNEYTYYEIFNNVASQFMLSPYVIPVFQVN